MDRRRGKDRRRARKRRGNPLGRFIAALAVLVFCGAASIPVLLTLSERQAALQPDPGMAQAGLELADVVIPEITLVP